MNSNWQIHKVGLIDFWYYDEEEFDFIDGRLLLRGANGSGKSVTMQSFIPLLLDGNMRPERLDPFGSRARKMENYLLEEDDGREERTGYLYMELKRQDNEAYQTLGIGMRARKNKKLESWYFCITDGRRIGQDILLYRSPDAKVTCSKLELRNRIGEGGRVMDSQGEYMQCVNRLLFGFETIDEYRELLDLLIQLRTPKLSKDFKPSIINEILSSSLQTLTEEDLRPMSEAIENMDGLKTNRDALRASVRAAAQIGRVYDQYNESVLCEKARLLSEAAQSCKELEAKTARLSKEILECEEQRQAEELRYTSLLQEERVLTAERDSLNASDAAKLKGQELKAEQELAEQQAEAGKKERQERGKKDRQLETEQKLAVQEEQNEQLRSELEEHLDEMESALEDVPFDEFAFLKKELFDAKEAYDFAPHSQLLADYMGKVERGIEVLREERASQEQYDRCLRELDDYYSERNRVERELRQYDQQLHETKAELTERIYQWRKENQELCPDAEAMQEIARRIEGYAWGADYSEVRGCAEPERQAKAQELAHEKNQVQQELAVLLEQERTLKEELAEWENQKDPEPEQPKEVLANRRILEEKGIPYLRLYKTVDFDQNLDEIRAARLEEALLRMGLLDALLVPEEYRETVRALDPGVCDRYIFSDVRHVRDNLMQVLDVDDAQNDILRYQEVSRVLSAIGCVPGTENGGMTWIDEAGNYQIGVLEGTVTGTYEPRYIGAGAREHYRQQKISELQEILAKIAEQIGEVRTSIDHLAQREVQLAREWKAFPEDQDLKVAAKECWLRENQLEAVSSRIAAQSERTEQERKRLDEIRLHVREICTKCDLAARLDVFEEAGQSLRIYREELTELRVTYHSWRAGLQEADSRREHLEEIEQDLDDVRYELGRIRHRVEESERLLASIRMQLSLTDYEQIRERLDTCMKRLAALPAERDACVQRKAGLAKDGERLREKCEEVRREYQQELEKRKWLAVIFAQEYRLGYVDACAVLREAEPEGLSQHRETQDASGGKSQRAEAQEGQTGKPLSADVQNASKLMALRADSAAAIRVLEELENLAAKVCRLLGAAAGGKKKEDLFASLQEVYHANRGELLDYQPMMQTLFGELDDKLAEYHCSGKRIDIVAKYHGVSMKFKELILQMREEADGLDQLISDREREFFEDILANTISKKIRGKIQASKRWVEQMNLLMESMKTSSGLTLSLRWKNRRADKEEQLDTRELVELLQKDAEIMREDEAEKLSRHFRSKIEEARKLAGDEGNVQSFHAIMREVLDYRKWFEFQLECQKTGDRKKELTDRVFFTFSGGEKAMSMYVPLFSAVVAKYAGARSDAPRLISLDEAFAGVDEMNIRDMFRLMVEFDFNFMINSQILWGDYDTVPGLAIYQLVRPENAKFVTVIRYIWNGQKKMLADRDRSNGSL